MKIPTVHDPQELCYRQGPRYYTPLAMLFIALFLSVNIVTQKIVPLGNYILLTAGDFIYPLNYSLSILLAEVYGYTMSRRVIWTSFGCNLLLVAIITLAIQLPHLPSWQAQEQFAAILGRTPRLLIASFSAFLVGEFSGTYLLAKIKILTAGKYLWLRTLSATSVGQLFDGLIFTLIAFFNQIGWHEMLLLGLSTYLWKIGYQVIMAPGTYAIALFLKKQEHIDIFDRHTNFNPFHLRIE